MKLTVTAEDIWYGQTGDAWNCPLANALKRTTGDSTMSVGRHTAGPANAMYKWLLSDEASQFLDDFDFDRAVYPVTFLNFATENTRGAYCKDADEAALIAQQKEAQEQ